MHRDITELSTGECTSLLDDKSLQVYDGTTVTTYKLISDKYYPTYTSTFSPPVDSSIICYTTPQLEELPSQYDFITPIYHAIAITSILMIVWLAYRLVIYPFFRRGV